MVCVWEGLKNNETPAAFIRRLGRHGPVPNGPSLDQSSRNGNWPDGPAHLEAPSVRRRRPTASQPPEQNAWLMRQSTAESGSSKTTETQHRARACGYGIVGSVARLRRRASRRAALPRDRWAPTVDSQSIASQLGSRCWFLIYWPQMFKHQLALVCTILCAARVLPLVATGRCSSSARQPTGLQLPPSTPAHSSHGDLKGQPAQPEFDRTR
jgi:hypothetical protein